MVRFAPFARLVFVTGLVIAGAAASAAAQPRVARDYFSILEAPRPSKMPDGSIVISMDVEGDLRGLITLTLERDGGEYKGTWALSSVYLETLRADGTPIPAEEHPAHGHDHEEPNTPALHREYVEFKFDGALSGTIESATIREGEDGVIVLDSARLVIDAGTRSFKDAAGFGQVGPWPNRPGAITLLLNF